MGASFVTGLEPQLKPGGKINKIRSEDKSMPEMKVICSDIVRTD